MAITTTLTPDELREISDALVMRMTRLRRKIKRARVSGIDDEFIPHWERSLFIIERLRETL